MAIKKKKLKVPKTIPLQLRLKRRLLRRYIAPNYSELFQKMSRKDFINFLFHKPFFAIHFSKMWIQDYSNVIRRLDSIFNFMHEDDIYKYFEINHSLNLHLDKESYTHSVFRVFTDLNSQLLSEETETLDLDDSPIYAYGITNFNDNSLVNLSREFIYYNRSWKDLNQRIDKKTLRKNLREIYQQELLPIDISLKSYLF